MNNAVPNDIRDMSMLSAEEKKLKAKEFAEGNVELEKFFLFLWNNNINTYACCGGHESASQDVQDNVIITSGNAPYIMIATENIPSEKYQTILKMLCLNDDISEIHVGNDNLEEDEEDIPRRYVTIYLDDYTCSMGYVADVFESVLSDGFIFKTALSKSEEDFIEAAVAINGIAVNDLDVSENKKFYKLFPEKVKAINLTHTRDINFKCEVMLHDKGYRFANSAGLSYLCPCAYLRDVDGSALYIDEEDNFYTLNDEDIKNMGLIEMTEYRGLIHELFEKDKNAVLNLLSSKKQKESEPEQRQ